MKLCDAQNGALRSNDYDIVDVDSLKPDRSHHFGINQFAVPELEQINKAAYWDYQRNRIYVRSSKRIKHVVTRKATKTQVKKTLPLNKTVE